MQRLARREGIRWRVETSHEGGASSLNGFLSRRSTSRSVDYYLDEFTFRFTRRSSRSRGLLFYRLLEQAALTSPAPVSYTHLRAHEPRHDLVCRLLLEKKKDALLD